MVLTRKRTVWAVLGLALAVVATDDAFAQRGQGGGRGGRGGRGMMGVSRVQLATLDTVQAALNLTDDEQKEAIETIDDEMSEARRGGGGGGGFGGGGGGNFAARMEQIQKLNEEFGAKLTAKLDETQNKRLTEIFVQANGANAITDPQVHAALAITEEQDKKLADARDENRQAMQDAMADFRDMSREEAQQAGNELREEANARLLAVLTEEQRDQFASLKGEEIEIDVSQLFGRRGGFGGGGGGGGRGDRGDRPNRPQRPE